MFLDNQFIKYDDYEEALGNIQEIICPKCGTMTPVEPMFDDFWECLTCGLIFSAKT